MDWLVLAVGEAAPFLSAPAVGCLSGAAPCSWEGPCASLQGAVRMGRHSKREGAVGVNAAAPQGLAPNRSRSCGCWSSCDDLSLKPSSIAGRNSSPSAPGSLPCTLPPHVPFPRHPSCHVLGSTAQTEDEDPEGKGGNTPGGCCWQGWPLLIRQDGTAGAREEPTFQQGCCTVEQGCCIPRTEPLPKPLVAPQAGAGAARELKVSGQHRSSFCH